MKIFVCVKQVPDTESKIQVKADKSGIEEAGLKWVMNPYDEFAVEEALKLKTTTNDAVVVVTAGPKSRAGDVVRTALAMGADEGILIDAPANLEMYQTAKVLAEAIRKEGDIRIVFTGKLAIDGNGSAVSQMTAEFLGIPHATVISSFSYGNESVTVEREVEGGTKETFKLQVPCLVGANKGLNTPRYASLPGIMKAKKKPLKEYSLDDLGFQSFAKPKLILKNFSAPSEKPPVKMLKGTPAEQAKELVQLLMNEAKVL